MNKIYTIAILGVFLVSLFATGFVLAQESEEETLAGVSVTDETQVSDDISGIDDLTPENASGMTSVTLVTRAYGWAVNSENTMAEPVSGHWVSRRIVDITPERIRQVNEENRGNPERVRAQLEKETQGKIRDLSLGILNIGVGDKKEVYRLVKKDFVNDSVSFYLVPIRTRSSDLKNESSIADLSSGTLDLNSKHYPDMTLRQGTLKLDEGKFTGTWEVDLGSKAQTLSNAEKPGNREGFFKRFVERFKGNRVGSTN